MITAEGIRALVARELALVEDPARRQAADAVQTAAPRLAERVGRTAARRAARADECA